MAETLPLTVAGKTYQVPSPPARIGLALQAYAAVVTARRKDLDPPEYALERLSLYDDPSRSMDQDSLGPVWQEMINDDVPYADLRDAARAAYVWVVSGSADYAYKMMDPAAEGEAVDSDPKAGSTSTGAASTTRKPGSTKPTTSRKKNSQD